MVPPGMAGADVQGRANELKGAQPACVLGAHLPGVATGEGGGVQDAAREAHQRGRQARFGAKGRTSEWTSVMSIRMPSKNLL